MKQPDGQFGSVVSTTIRGEKVALRKVRENSLYGRFLHADGRVVRLLTGKSINRIPLRIWKDTSVTLKVLDRPKVDLDGNSLMYAPGVPVKHNIRSCVSEHTGKTAID